MKKILLIVMLAAAIPALGQVKAVQNSVPAETSITLMDYKPSLDELLEQFRGKVVYIDIMASWCKPCLAQFPYTLAMDDFFEDNGIVKVYISIDNDDVRYKCFEILKEAKIKGYYIPYNAVNNDFGLAKDITEKFLKDENGNISISIPRYVIVDKEGEIRVPRAERPSNRSALEKQLKEYL